MLIEKICKLILTIACGVAVMLSCRSFTHSPAALAVLCFVGILLGDFLVLQIPGKQKAFENLCKEFGEAGLESLWYVSETSKTPGKWYAGIWTCRDGDLLCVKPCGTSAEADAWLSPAAMTPEQAMRLALEKRFRLSQGKPICHRCGDVGRSDQRDGDCWCSECREMLGLI
jgi:hypothetical protein